MRVLLLALAWLAGASLHSAPEPGVVDLEAQEAPAATEGWAELEPKLQGAEALEALSAYLKKHPKGRAASRALYERGKRLDNLDESGEAWRQSFKEDAQGPWGRLSAVELGKQEYLLGHSEAALMILDQVDDEQLQGEPRAQLLFWRAQCRLVNKGFQRSQDEFENFLGLFPDHALGDAARLAVADCDAALKNTDAALAGYQKLYQAPASGVAPQAYLQAAALNLKLGRKAEASALLAALSKAYPDSLEAGRARDLLKELPVPAVLAPTPTAVPGKAEFTVQVGAYARRVIAEATHKKLKKKGYAARLEKRVINDNVLIFVQVGKFKTRAQAQAQADKIKAREKMPALIVEIRPEP